MSEIGVDTPPEHDEARSRREFKLRSAAAARREAARRLANWRSEHPDCAIVAYRETR